MENNWEKPYEEDGVTLGPEDALRRETEKTKALKIEKLQLQDAIEKLKEKNYSLAKINHSLEKQLGSITDKLIKNNNEDSAKGTLVKLMGQTPTIKLTFFLLFFNLAAAGFLLIWLLK